VFMSEAPFRGRLPLFAGDDVTDELGFTAVQGMQGQGVKVGTGPSAAQFHCDSPQALRSWLSFSTKLVSPPATVRRRA